MNDVRLTEDGDLPEYTEHISGLALIEQKIRIRLRTFRGEWMLDTSQGLPFFDWLKQKPIRINEVENRIRAEIAATNGVTSIPDLSVGFRRADAEIKIVTTVDTDYGTTDLEYRLSTR